MAEDTGAVDAPASRTHSFVDDATVARAEQLDQYPRHPRAWGWADAPTADSKPEASDCLSNAEGRAIMVLLLVMAVMTACCCCLDRHRACCLRYRNAVYPHIVLLEDDYSTLRVRL